ncbi:MAG: hypothetical protein JXR34_09265 [Bacteroidales bacterium]|nr:hypothetical protein [Bacteroidales bacterium]
MKSILIIVVLALAITSCKVDPKKRFVLSPKEALVAANHQTNIITPHMLADILYVEDSTLKYTFVDLRSPLEFDAGHIRGAINIPFSSITKNNNCRTFLEKDAINILYGSSTEEVVFAGFILQQIGVRNFFIVHGNYDFIKEHIIDNYHVLSANYNPETPKYDFAELVRAGKSGETKVKAPAQNFQPVKSGKKKEAAGGGCD